MKKSEEMREGLSCLVRLIETRKELAKSADAQKESVDALRKNGEALMHTALLNALSTYREAAAELRQAHPNSADANAKYTASVRCTERLLGSLENSVQETTLTLQTEVEKIRPEYWRSHFTETVECFCNFELPPRADPAWGIALSDHIKFIFKHLQRSVRDTQDEDALERISNVVSKVTELREHVSPPYAGVDWNSELDALKKNLQLLASEFAENPPKLRSLT